jgi:hypothetical protein
MNIHRLAAFAVHFALYFASFSIGPFIRAEINSAGATNTRDWPTIPLRGYGTLSGTSAQWTLPAGPASILQIHCDNEEKAKLVHSKYRSDLGLLPGVKEVAGGSGTISHWEVDGIGGVMASARAGQDVYIFQASAAADLAPLLAGHFTGDRAALVFTSETEVPMYLDRWDKYGFRFYYQASSPPTPKGEKPVPYDFDQDFAFAEKSDHAGLVFWDGTFGMDSAAGQMNVPTWNWTMEAARARHLPVAINDSLGNPLWLTNRYRNETMFKATDFLGSANVAARPEQPTGALSWNATEGRDAILSQVQTTVRHFVTYPNLVSWLDPDGEIPLTPQGLMTDYGPASDAGFRKHLQEKYHDLATVSQRWYGDAKQLKSWDDVQVPQLSYFRGDGPDAFDLKGTWRIGYEPGPAGKVYTNDEISAFRSTPVPTDPAPDEWFQPTFDDSAWPELTAPGDGVALFMPRRPAVFRRTFDLPESILKKNDHWWLYVWDLNYNRPAKMWAYLNGTKVGESAIFDNHWAAFEVTSQLQSGKNQISLRLPSGIIAYRIYLSPQPVTDYPNLGEQKNAEWVDFTEWGYYARIDSVHRSIEMIRQIDPNRQITFMHPDEYGDGVKEIAEDFGGEFHCTGYMSAFFAELEPKVMRGSDLPSSLEPGGPAGNVVDFKNQIGLNISEGIQGLDYFQRLTDVLWHDDIRANFEDHLKMIHMIGKYHAPKAEAALLFDNRVTALTGYPWGADPDVLLHSGYWAWNVSAGLLEQFPTDGVMEFDFARGNAAKYKVIIDSNTTIMDEDLVNQIEKYVRDGGIFITCAQTGRHTPTRINAWPIERLTGYHVSSIDKNVRGGIPESHPIQPAPGSDVFANDDWNNELKPNGLMLDKVAPDCQDLMLWDNGKTAVGLRPLGKGFIVQVGVKFSGTGVADRWDSPPRPDDIAWAKLYTRLLEHFKIAHLPATLSEEFSPVIWRHYVSNNGLYDVWTLWNRSKTEAQKVSLQFTKGLAPASALEIKNEPVAFPVTKTDSGSALQDITFEPSETRMFITPHAGLENAATDWFQLQRNWWRGTAKIRKELPPFHDAFTENLDADWSFQPLTETSDVTAMSAPGYDDSKWERRPIGIWGLADHPEVKHALLRKKFTVPANWTNGDVRFWLTAQWGKTFYDDAHIFLDGTELKPRAGGIGDNDGGGTLKPGSEHLVTVDVQGDGSLVGVGGAAWLSFIPDAEKVIDLNGDWDRSDDYMTFDHKLTFPGQWDGYAARKVVTIDKTSAGKNIIVDFNGPMAVNAVVINGIWLGHHATWAQEHWLINVTPWVKFGQDNEIKLLGSPVNARDNSNVAGVKIDIYDPKTYP